MIKTEREDNGTKGRFLIYVDEAKAGEMSYTWAGEKKFIIDHTEVDPAFSGKGLGNQLVMAAVHFARSEKLSILPLCPFAKKVFDTDSAIRDVLV